MRKFACLFSANHVITTEPISTKGTKIEYEVDWHILCYYLSQSVNQFAFTDLGNTQAKPREYTCIVYTKYLLEYYK